MNVPSTACVTPEASTNAGQGDAPRALGRRLQQSLSRITSGGSFIPTLDGLRFLAIFAVVLYHLAGNVAKSSPYTSAAAARDSFVYAYFDQGHCGVQLFFIISGFILAIPFVDQFIAGKPPVSLQKYYRRRVTRLVPPYVCNLLVAYVIQVAAGHGTVYELWPHFLASLFYIHNLTFSGVTAINGMAWSLEVEVQFYVLAPVMGRLFAIPRKIVRRGVLIGIIVALAAVKSCLDAYGTEVYFWRGTIAWYLDFFLAGFLLADIYVADWNRNPSRTSWWDVWGLAGWGLVFLVQNLTGSTYWLALPAIVAYIGAFRGKFLNRVFCNPWFVTIGGMCYTIYLYHFFIIAAVGRGTLQIPAGHGFAGNFLLQAALICPVIVGISAVLFVLFEKPFMRPGVLLRAQPAASSA